MRLIAITSKTLEAFRPYIVQSQLRYLEKAGVYGLGLAEGSHSCGALLIRNMGETWELLNLYVDPKMRGQGGGKLLLAASKALAVKHGAKALCAEYLFENAAEMECFSAWLMKNGFLPPSLKAYHYDGNTKRVLNARKLRDAPQDGKGLIPLAQVSPMMLHRFCEEQDIPELLRPDGLDGVPDRELSLCCVEEGTLRGYVLFNLLGGTLYMGAACFAPGYPLCVYRTIRVAVARAFRRLADSPAHICAVDPVAAGMIEELSDGLYDKRSEEWHSECPLTQDEPGAAEASGEEEKAECCKLVQAGLRLLCAAPPKLTVPQDGGQAPVCLKKADRTAQSVS